MVLAVESETRKVGFRYEAEMLHPLRQALPRLGFGHAVTNQVRVFTEVPAMFGVPDLTAIRFDEMVIAHRLAAGVRPLSTDTEVRSVMALEDEPQRAVDLAKRLRLHPDYLRRSVLPMLQQLGWIERNGNEYSRVAAAQWTDKRIVTVEAKLRDWRQALDQVRRQSASADAAYLALDAQASHLVEGMLSRFAVEGLGVLEVHASRGHVRALTRPHRRPRARNNVGRRLLAERCLDLLLDGRNAGQVAPVFGWTVPEGLLQ